MITVDDAVTSAERFGERFCAMARSATDPTRRIAGLDWTVHQLVAHIASGAIAYTDMVAGVPSPYTSLDERTAVNQSRLEEELGSDVVGLVDVIEQQLSQIFGALRGTSQRALAWHGGIELPSTAFVGALVGELMIHGLDLARTLGHPWPLPRVDCLSAVEFFNTATPYVVDRRAATVSASIDVRYRGYAPSTFTFDAGRLRVSPGSSPRADVHMNVDPVGFLLVGYRRRGLAATIARGQAMAWGRKPWLALQFPRFFQAP